MRAGLRLACPQCTTEVIVVRAPGDDVGISCGDAPLVAVEAERSAVGHTGDDGGGALLGKRYVDDQAGLELLCTKAGPGTLACEGRALDIKAPKPLPSSD